MSPLSLSTRYPKVDMDSSQAEISQLRAKIATLEELLQMYEESAIEQEQTLQQALYKLQERAQQLEHAQTTLQTLQSILDSMGDAVVVTTDKGEAMLLNPAAKELFEGESLDQSFHHWNRCHRLMDADGRSPLDIELHPLSLATRGVAVDGAELKFVRHTSLTQGAGRQDFSRQSPQTQDINVVLSDRTQNEQPLDGPSLGRWFSVNARPILESESIMGAVAVFRDISRQKKTEAALQQSHKASEKQAKLLKKILKKLKAAQADLVQSEKMNSLGRTVAGIAHEINNPVNFIHGNLEHAKITFQDLLSLIHLFQETYRPPAPEITAAIEDIDLEFLEQDIPKLLASMQAGTGRVREIVESLRSFSRLDEAGSKAVNVHEGLDSVLMILQPTFAAHMPPIEIHKLYGDLPQVECHARAINQAFVSILDNAVWALRDNQQPQITIQTQQRDRHIVITITDNGTGIPDAVQTKIFDPFFTTKPVGQGTGLGLSTCYQTIVETHSGSLQCLSTVGEGSQFIIMLPLAQTTP